MILLVFRLRVHSQKLFFFFSFYFFILKLLWIYTNYKSTCTLCQERSRYALLSFLPYIVYITETQYQKKETDFGIMYVSGSVSFITCICVDSCKPWDNEITEVFLIHFRPPFVVTSDLLLTTIAGIIDLFLSQ